MIKKWLSFLVILSFVVTTMSPYSHAYMIHDVGAQASKVSSAHEDCHTDAKASSNKEHHKKTDHKSSCEKRCTCMANSCHGIKILSFDASSILPRSFFKSVFSSSQEVLVGSFTGRIKRPPRA
jgi:hypothetical protein